jgi:multidrug efflux pump subunit AcrB
MSLARIAVERQAVTLFLAALIIVGGIFSFFQLGWLEDPDFSVKTAVIVVPYPGASAEEVENEVTDVIESALQEMPQVKELYSLSRPGSSLIRVDINPRFWAAELPQVWDEMRRKINDARPRLPPGVGEPIIGDDFGFVYGFLMAVTGDGYSYAELETYAEDLQTQLGVVPGVARVELWGVQQRVIYLDVSEQQLAAFGISPQVFTATLSQQNMVVNAGGIDAQDKRLRVAPTGAFTSPQDIERLVLTDVRDQPVTVTTPSGARTLVAPSGTPSRTTELITIGDLGTVSSGYASPPTQLMRFNYRDADGKFQSAPAIGIAIANAAGGNVVQTGQNIDVRLRQIEADLPLGIQLHRIAWQSDLVVDSIKEFMISLGQAVAIVLLVLIVPVGWRTGVVIGTALLLTLLATFVAMAIMGENLHRMSLGALVIALGMMVDNAIVVADNFLVRIQKGMDRKQAAIEAADLPAWPLLGATIVAVLAFFPIYLSEESAGEYTRALFTVVGISLLLSWVISLTVTPLQLIYMIPAPRQDTKGETAEGGFYRAFRAFVVKAVRYRFVFVASLLAGLVIAVGAFERVPRQFFPDADRAQFLLDYWAPEGTRIQQVAADTRAIEARLLEDPRVVSVSTFIGGGPPRFYLPVDSEYPNQSFANLIVNTTSGDVVSALADEMKAWLFDNVPQAMVRVRLYALGPSNPWKFQARIVGPSNADPDELRALGEEGLRILDGHPWLAEARVDWRERVRVVEPIFNDERARWAGVAREDVASATRRATDGVPVGLYREGNKLLPIKIRHVEDERNSLATLDVLQIQSSSGPEPVPLSQVTSGLEINWHNPILARFQKRPTITVEAEPVRGVTLADFMASVRDQFEAMELPPGYELFWDGEYADSNASQASLIPGIVPAVAIMLFILIALFNAFRPVAIILLIIPFVFIGISPALLVTQAPFGFVALLGAMSLSGMMIKNAVVLFEEINLELASGKLPHQAIVDSAISRTRPVLLAAGTTVLGVIPLLGDVFFRSLALTIMGGLLIGSLLTLVLVPVLYAIFYRVKSPGTETA